MTGNFKSKEELIKAIKDLAKNLEERAEDIAVDWNKKIFKIEFKSIIEPGYILTWDITKSYLGWNHIEGVDNSDNN